MEHEPDPKGPVRPELDHRPVGAGHKGQHLHGGQPRPERWSRVHTPLRSLLYPLPSAVPPAAPTSSGETKREEAEPEKLGITQKGRSEPRATS